MMLVPSRLGPSPLEGLGLFAVEPIPFGQPVWRLDPDLDRLLPPAALTTLPPVQQQFLQRYAYFDPQLGALILCGDDARFMNHSSNPNVSSVRDGLCTALRPIAAGEELTCNYFDLDPRPMEFTPRG